MERPLIGGCRCGAVRHRVSAGPLCIYACHGTSSGQQRSGSALSLGLVLPDDTQALLQAARDGRGGD